MAESVLDFGLAKALEDRAERTWDDLPWAEHRVTLI